MYCYKQSLKLGCAVTPISKLEQVAFSGGSIFPTFHNSSVCFTLVTELITTDYLTMFI